MVVFLNTQAHSLSQRAIWRFCLLKEVYTWFCFTRLVSNHQKCKSIRQLPDLWLMKKKKDVADKEKERLFWSNIRGVQQNRCRYCDEKWSERGRVMRLWGRGAFKASAEVWSTICLDPLPRVAANVPAPSAMPASNHSCLTVHQLPPALREPLFIYSYA